MMRRLVPRMLLLSGIVSVVLVFGGALFVGRAMALVLISTVLHVPVLRDNLQTVQCEKGWSPFSRFQMAQVRALDSRRLRAMTPAQRAASGLPPRIWSMLKQLTPEQDLVTRVNSLFVRPWAAVTLLRVPPKGRCDLLFMRWKRANPIRRELPSKVALLMGVGLLVAITLAMALVIFPTLRRLHRVTVAAKDVGEEASYQSAADAIQDSIGQLSASLDRAHLRICDNTRALEQSHKALERHLADVAHDLRTPLASLQVALEHLGKQLPADADKQWMNQAFDEITYVTALTNNLHLASQLEDGVHPLSTEATVDLTELVSRVVVRFATISKRREVQVDGAFPDEPLWVRCSPVMAEQALANLVQNAVFHNRPGGHVAVLLKALQAQRFHISIFDDGPGLPEGALAGLGSHTFRHDLARTRNEKQPGLGLAITHEITARAGWSLSFAPNQPEGLHVTITGSLLDKKEEAASKEPS